jgi:hypothetical protein
VSEHEGPNVPLKRGHRFYTFWTDGGSKPMFSVRWNRWNLTGPFPFKRWATRRTNREIKRLKAALSNLYSSKGASAHE